MALLIPNDTAAICCELVGHFTHLAGKADTIRRLGNSGVWLCSGSGIVDVLRISRLLLLSNVQIVVQHLLPSDGSFNFCVLTCRSITSHWVGSADSAHRYQLDRG